MIRIRCTDRNQGMAHVQFSHEGVPAESIQGQLRGPYCEYSRTLTATQHVTAGAVMVVDPCYWTPKLPFLYEARLDYETDQGQQHVEFRFGLRWCVTDRTGLRLDGKGFVARCVSPASLHTAPATAYLNDFREAAAGLWMPRFCEETCREASQRGVLVACAAPLDATQTAQVDRFPAVHFANSSYELAPDIIRLVHDQPQPGCVLVAEEDSLGNTSQPANTPQFIHRHSSTGDVRQLRRHCDELQRDVAPIGQFAGYIVSQTES